MTKAFRKAISTRSKLKNIYVNSRNEENWVNYKDNGISVPTFLFVQSQHERSK